LKEEAMVFSRFQFKTEAEWNEAEGRIVRLKQEVEQGKWNEWVGRGVDGEKRLEFVKYLIKTGKLSG
jgi:hypothetical protein